MKKSLYVRNMLMNYDKQLVNARRLARFMRSIRAAGGDDVQISREAKRNMLVERVAKEIIENLIIAGSDNPIVDNIKQRLQEDYGQKLHFKYPPDDEDLQIFAEGEEGTNEIAGTDKIKVLNRLWQITLDTVDETML